MSPPCAQKNDENLYCENYGKSLAHFFDKNFVKAAHLLKKLLKS